MNRIYQGRVTKVETLDGNNAEPQPLDNWPEKLRQHHESFQDVVNYYTLALAGRVDGLDDRKPVDGFIAQETVVGEANPKFKEGKKKEEAIEKTRKTAMAKVEAVKRWRDQVSGKWFEVRKKAQKFAGPAKRLAGQDKVEIPDPQNPAKQVELPSGMAFWRAVKKLQWQRCREINEARLAAWKDKLNPRPD